MKEKICEKLRQTFMIVILMNLLLLGYSITTNQPVSSHVHANGDSAYSSNDTVDVDGGKTPPKAPCFDPVFLIGAVIVAFICGIIVAVVLWKKKRIV